MLRIEYKFVELAILRLSCMNTLAENDYSWMLNYIARKLHSCLLTDMTSTSDGVCRVHDLIPCYTVFLQWKQLHRVSCFYLTAIAVEEFFNIAVQIQGTFLTHCILCLDITVVRQSFDLSFKIRIQTFSNALLWYSTYGHCWTDHFTPDQIGRLVTDRRVSPWVRSKLEKHISAPCTELYDRCKTVAYRCVRLLTLVCRYSMRKLGNIYLLESPQSLWTVNTLNLLHCMHNCS